MRKLLKYVSTIRREEHGATAVEYAVMLAMILMAVLSAVRLVGQSASNSFQDSSTKINAAAGS